jgi:hypothetical protein
VRPPGIYEYLDILRALAALGTVEGEQLRFLEQMRGFTQQDGFREREFPQEMTEPIFPTSLPVPEPELPDHTVFISYASSVEDLFVDRLYQSLIEEGINAKIDKIDLKYRESLGNYIEKLGNGSAIVIIVSDKYLRSPWCMWELLNIYKAKDFQDRVFPVVMADAEITDGIGRLGYAEYWETRLRNFDTAMQKVNRLAISDATVEEGRRIREFADKVDTLASMVADMNFRTMDEPTEDALKILGENLVSRLNVLSNRGNEY